MHKDFLHWGFYILKGNTCENILGKLCTIIKVYKAYGKNEVKFGSVSICVV